MLQQSFLGVFLWFRIRLYRCLSRAIHARELKRTLAVRDAVGPQTRCDSSDSLRAPSVRGPKCASFPRSPAFCLGYKGSFSSICRPIWLWPNRRLPVSTQSQPSVGSFRPRISKRSLAWFFARRKVLRSAVSAKIAGKRRNFSTQDRVRDKKKPFEQERPTRSGSSHCFFHHESFYTGNEACGYGYFVSAEQVAGQ